MSQPAQNSGHEWAATSAGDKKFTVVCRCGAHLEADADTMIAAHVASVAQAAQPPAKDAVREALQAGIDLVESAYAHVSHGGPTRADAEKWLKEAKDALS